MIKKLLPVPTAIVCLLLITVGAWAETFHSSNGYSVTAPRRWSISPGGTAGSDVILITKPQDGYASNVNVHIDTASAGLTLEQIQTQLKTLYPKTFTKYKSLSERFNAIGSERSYEVLFNYDQGTPLRTLWVRQDVVIHNGKIYIVTCSALASNVDHIRWQFDSIINSVQWASKEALPEHRQFRRRRTHKIRSKTQPSV